MTLTPSLAERARSSAWVGEVPGLADAVAEWERTLGARRAGLGAEAARLARPGPLSPLRAARYATALRCARLRWEVSAVTALLVDHGDPPWRGDAWLQRGVAQVLRDQLALLGPAGAEIGRIIDASEGLVPGVLVEELRRHPVDVRPFAPPVAERIVHTAFGRRVGAVSEEPVAYTPVSQLHTAELADGKAVLVRVRRPRVARTLPADARITATIVAPLERLIPALRGPHPLGFVELAARQLLEETDLRHEALNAVALGVALESMGVEGVTVARPLPGLVGRRALVMEHPGGSPLAGAAPTDGAGAAAGLVAIALEAGLGQGVFAADLAREHLYLTGEGRLALVGCGTAGRLDTALRRAALAYLAAVLGGDHAGQVDAMRAAGAVPPGVGVEALVADLSSTPSLDPMAMLSGGEASVVAGLRDAVSVLLRHGIRPPIEAVLFVRNVFLLRPLLADVAPGTSLMAALMPFVQRLPQMAAELR